MFVKPSCRFCSLVAQHHGRKVLGSEVVHVDDLILVKTPKHPRSKFHRLIISHEHISQNELLHDRVEHWKRTFRSWIPFVKAYSESESLQFAFCKRHENTLKRMISVGIQLLNENGFNTHHLRCPERYKNETLDADDPRHSRLVFHIPPFNSQDHLHLHVFGGVFDNLYYDWAHRPDKIWTMTPFELLRNGASKELI